MVKVLVKNISVDEKETFIQMLTHDLKTPIRAQLQALELLLGGAFGEISPAQKEILNELAASNKYMQNMAENVLHNYRKENGKLKFNKEKHDLKQTLEYCLKNLKYIILPKNQRIEIRFKKEFSSIGYYDEIEIARVLTNLITNASEHSPNGSSIEIEVSDSDDFFKIKVKDCGEGIKNPEELFQKFSTAAHSRKKIGTGLGLYISRAIIEAHGGKICAKNRKSRGAIISFTILKNQS